MQDLQKLQEQIPMLGKRVQLAFVVPDLDAAMEFWTKTMKVGPFIVIEKSVGDRRVVHRGKDTQMDMSLAFSYLGDIQIELVWQSNSEPSPYKEFLDSGQQGFHHFAFWPEDFEGTCRHFESSGYSEVCSIYMRDGTRNVAYYDSPKGFGPMVEIVPMTPARMAYFSRIQRLANTWDGSRPVRRYVDRDAFLASREGAVD